MAGFNEAWEAVARDRDGETVSPDLKPLLFAVYTSLISSPVQLATIKSNLDSLLTYLASQGRTTVNCWAVDLFFCISDGWERDWTEQELPDDYHDILAKMGEALHDTVKSPEIAANFECLPEQLLVAVRQLRA
jgi:hypothetical protein